MLLEIQETATEGSVVRTSRRTTKSLGLSIELPEICVMSLVPDEGVPTSVEREMYDREGEAKLDVRPITCTAVGVTANSERVSVELEYADDQHRRVSPWNIDVMLTLHTRSPRSTGHVLILGPASVLCGHQ